MNDSNTNQGDANDSSSDILYGLPKSAGPLMSVSPRTPAPMLLGALRSCNKCMRDLQEWTPVIRHHQACDLHEAAVAFFDMLEGITPDHARENPMDFVDNEMSKLADVSYLLTMALIEPRNLWRLGASRDNCWQAHEVESRVIEAIAHKYRSLRSVPSLNFERLSRCGVPYPVLALPKCLHEKPTVILTVGALREA